MPLSLILVLVGLLLNVALFLVGMIIADRRRRKHLARLDRAKTSTAHPALVVVKTRRRRPAPEELGPLARGLSGIEKLLDQSVLNATLNEIIVQIGMAMLGLYAALVLGLRLPLGLALVVAITVAGAGLALVLQIARAKYRTAFVAQLPEALDVFARGLRAGRPVTDSLGIVVQNASGPVQREFSRCHDEIRMGHSLHDSLDRLAQRLPLPEIMFFSVAVTLQSETGGNLIETMESLASQLRERRKLRKKARALSAEARASALILAALPFAVALAIVALNAGYLKPLYADARGQVMALGAMTMIGLGVLVMMRMGKLDV